MVRPLCDGYFPLHLEFQCLEEKSNVNVVSVDFESKKEHRSSAVAAMRKFLVDQDAHRKGFADKFYDGFSFVEAIYVVVQNLMIECQLIKMDDFMLLLSVLIDSVGHFSLLDALKIYKFIKANESLDYVQSSHHDSNLKETARNKMKSSALSVLLSILRKAEQARLPAQDINATKELITSAAISCLAQLKWSEQELQNRDTTGNLKKIIFCILSSSFSSKLSSKSEDPHHRFRSLMNICLKNKHLIPAMADFIEHLWRSDELVGISFIAQVVKITSQRSDTLPANGKKGSFQDEAELAVMLLADFASRYDPLFLISLHLGSLLHILENEKAAVRKCLCVIIGSCLRKFDLISSTDQYVLAQICEVLSRDRDATCRLRVLTYLGYNLNWLHWSNSTTISLLLSLLSKRALDKSKLVRLKAIQILEVILMDERVICATVNSPLNSITMMSPTLILEASKLLVMSPDSRYFCQDTREAVCHLLCSRYFKGSSVFELLHGLLHFYLTSSNVMPIFNIFKFHLDGYEMWIEFLIGESEDAIIKLKDLLLLAANNSKSEISKFAYLVEEIFNALENTNMIGMENANPLKASCALLTILLSLHCFKIASIDKKGQHLVSILAMCMEISNDSAAIQIKKQISKWAFKALAILLEEKNKLLQKEAKRFLEENFYFYQDNGVDEYLDCLYHLSDPLSIVQKILNTYEEKLQVLQTIQPLKRVYIYIKFLGQISRNYDMACSSFIKCLRKMETDLCKPLNSSLGCGYLQEDELRSMEEDAVARFSHMLLDGDSVPGCYVPFLRELSTAEDLPVAIRVAATESLGEYMLSSIQLAKDLKDIPENFLQSEIAQLKLVGLELVEKLVIKFPDDFSSSINLIGSCLGDEILKEPAYHAYVRLMLQDKFNADFFLAPISIGLSHKNNNVRMLTHLLLKNFLSRTEQSKIKSVLQLYNNMESTESKNELVKVLVGSFLDKNDVQSDELAIFLLQLLTRGKHEACFFASFLCPSYRVLNAYLSHLTATPPKIDLEGKTEEKNYLIRFVMNYKCQGTTPGKDLVEKLLDILGNKVRRKRKGPMTREDDAWMSPDEYEAAIVNFKNCHITDSLRKLITMNS